MVHTQLPIKARSNRTNNQKLLTHIVYCLFFLGIATFGLLIMFTIASILIIYIKRSDTLGTIYSSHFDWLSKTFWITLATCLISILFIPIYIGYLGFFSSIIWAVYRMVKGWLCLLNEDSPISF